MAIGISNTNSNMFKGNISQVRITPAELYTTNFTDTCYYTGTYVYAPLNDIDSTHVIVNGSAITTHIPMLSNISACHIIDTTDTNVGITNILSNEDIKVYPNPCVNNLHIEVKNEALVTIYDMTGKCIYNNTINNTATINISKGFYIVNVNNNHYKVIAE